MKSYLHEADQVSWAQMEKDLASFGLKNESIKSDFPKFVDSKGRIRAMIHHSDSNTSYDHLHIFNNKQKSLDKDLKIVSKR